MWRFKHPRGFVLHVLLCIGSSLQWFLLEKLVLIFDSGMASTQASTPTPSILKATTLMDV
jgi:hypothetical protein